MPTTVLCDVRTTLAGRRAALRPAEGRDGRERRRARAATRGHGGARAIRGLAGAGAAGGLGAALAALGAELVAGAPAVLDLVGFDGRLAGCDLAVTGEGQVDRTTAEGKAPGVVAERCAAAGVRCVVFGGRVVEPVDGAETVSLSGDRASAEGDLEALGRRLAA